jgi:hypothetical protein
VETEGATQKLGACTGILVLINLPELTTLMDSN